MKQNWKDKEKRFPDLIFARFAFRNNSEMRFHESVFNDTFDINYDYMQRII